MTDGSRRFSRKEVESLVGRVARQALSDDDASYSEDELVELARQVGLREEDVRRAILTGEGTRGRGDKIIIERWGDDVRVSLQAPGLTRYLLAQATLYGCVTVFAIVGLVFSGFGLVAWLGTAPFILSGGLLLFRMLSFATTRTVIDIKGANVVVRTISFGRKWSATTGAARTHASGPLPKRQLLDLNLMRLPFLRVVCDDFEIDLAHGLSEGEIRTVLRAIKPRISSVHEIE
jgi:hypothetical protein